MTIIGVLLVKRKWPIIDFFHVILFKRIEKKSNFNFKLIVIINSAINKYRTCAFWWIDFEKDVQKPIGKEINSVNCSFPNRENIGGRILFLSLFNSLIEYVHHKSDGSKQISDNIVGVMK